MSLILNYLVKAALEKGFYSYILVSIKSSSKLFRADTGNITLITS